MAILVLALIVAAGWRWNARRLESLRLNETERRLVGVWTMVSPYARRPNDGLIILTDRRTINVGGFNFGWKELPAPRDRWRATEDTLTFFQGPTTPRSDFIEDWLEYVNTWRKGGYRYDQQIVRVTEDELVIRAPHSDEVTFRRSDNPDLLQLFQILEANGD